jgi:hypothetical protein
LIVIVDDPFGIAGFHWGMVTGLDDRGSPDQLDDAKLAEIKLIGLLPLPPVAEFQYTVTLEPCKTAPVGFVIVMVIVEPEVSRAPWVTPIQASAVGVIDGVSVMVDVRVIVGVLEGVRVEVGVEVAVAVGKVPVTVGVRVRDAVGVKVLVVVEVIVGVRVIVGVKVSVGVFVAVFVGVKPTQMVGGEVTWMEMDTNKVRALDEVMVYESNWGIRSRMGEYCVETETLMR